MENTKALIPAFVADARLKHIRFARVVAERLTVAKGGVLVLNVTTTSTRHKTDTDKALFRVVMDAHGLPQDALPGAEDIFKISLEIRGIYQWPRVISEQELKDVDLQIPLFQPIFLLGSQKITDLLAHMGVKGVEIDLDLRALTDESPERTKLLESVRPSKKHGISPLPLSRKAPASKQAARKSKAK